MYFIHIGKREVHFFPSFSPFTIFMQEAVVVAVGEDRFVMMVTEFVALFALWETYALWLTPWAWGSSHLECKLRS